TITADAKPKGLRRPRRNAPRVRIPSTCTAPKVAGRMALRPLIVLAVPPALHVPVGRGPAGYMRGWACLASPSKSLAMRVFRAVFALNCLSEPTAMLAFARPRTRTGEPRLTASPACMARMVRLARSGGLQSEERSFALGNGA